MYLLEGPNEEFSRINDECKHLIKVLMSGIPAMQESVRIGAGDSIYGDSKEGVICLVRKGYVNYIKDGQTLYIFDEGDLVGLEKIYCDNYSSYVAEDEVLVDVYSVKVLFDEIKENHVKFEMWNRYLSHQINVHGLLVSSLMKAEVEYKPTVLEFKQGDVIIEEGSEGNEVFTMLSGTAHASVQGVKVGEIHSDEIFGAIAALTGLARTATVTAVSPCTVVSVDKASFMKLIESRPNIILKLAEDMTRVIVSANNQVVKLSSNAAC